MVRKKSFKLTRTVNLIVQNPSSSRQGDKNVIPYEGNKKFNLPGHQLSLTKKSYDPGERQTGTVYTVQDPPFLRIVKCG
jgi:hypothetical protein